MAGINIDIAANVRDFQAATTDAEQGLEQVSDALDALARGAEQEARKAGRGISDGFKDGTRDAERAVDDLGDGMADSVQKGAREVDQETEKLEKSFKELADTAKKETGNLGSDMSTSVKKGAHEASEATSTFKDEARQNAEEVASSFDGSAQSIGDGFQSIAATAFAGFGPAGAIAGLAAAAGLGVIFAKLEEGGEKSEEFKAKVAELGSEFIDAGGKGEASLEYVIDKLKELATTTEDGVVNLEDLQEAVTGAGNGKNFDDIATAVAGANENIDEMLRKEQERLKLYEREAQQSSQVATGVYKDNLDKAMSQQVVVDELTKAKDAADQAKAAEEAYAAAGGPELAAKAELISNVNDAYDEAAGGAEDFIDKESGLFDVQGFIDSMNQREQALREYQETLATAALSPEARAFISSQGVESAATFMAGYKTATPAQQQELNRIWSEAGKTSSGAFSASTQASLTQAGYKADVKLVANDADFRAYLSRQRFQVKVDPATVVGPPPSVLKRVP